MKNIIRKLRGKRPFISNKGRAGFVLHAQNGKCISLDSELMSGSPTTIEVYFGGIKYWDSGDDISEVDRGAIREQVESLLGNVHIIWR